jgi:putative ABC transport system permease protein
MKLLLKLVWKDFKQNKVITTVLTVFLILSAVLMAGGLRMVGTIMSSLSGLNELAMLPQYLQMHSSLL